MKYILSRKFEKQFAQLPKGVKKKAVLAFELFVLDPSNPTLREHALAGKWFGYLSIDVTGDYRAVYTHVDEQVVRFVTIGTHSQLYG